MRSDAKHFISMEEFSTILPFIVVGLSLYSTPSSRLPKRRRTNDLHCHTHSIIMEMGDQQLTYFPGEPQHPGMHAGGVLGHKK